MSLKETDVFRRPQPREMTIRQICLLTSHQKGLRRGSEAEDKGQLKRKVAELRRIFRGRKRRLIATGGTGGGVEDK